MGRVGRSGISIGGRVGIGGIVKLGRLGIVICGIVGAGRTKTGSWGRMAGRVESVRNGLSLGRPRNWDPGG